MSILFRPNHLLSIFYTHILQVQFDVILFKSVPLICLPVISILSLHHPFLQHDPKPFKSTYFQYSYNIWRSEHIVNFLIHISSPGTISICWPTYFSKSRDNGLRSNLQSFYKFVSHEWVNMCSIYESWLLSRSEVWGSISGRDVISCIFITTFKTALTKSSWVYFPGCKDILRLKTDIPEHVVPIQNGLNLFISMCQQQEFFFFSPRRPVALWGPLSW